MYHMFILADEFKIPPWQHNEDGEVYKDDLTTIIALKYFQHAASKREHDKANLNATLRK